MTEEKNVKKQWYPMFIGVGIAIGAGLGIAIDNLAMGIGIGLALGVALDAVMLARIKKQNDEAAGPAD